MSNSIIGKGMKMNKMDDRELRLNGLINSFDLNKSRYDDFEKSLNNLISRIVETSKVVVHDVTSRRKGRASFIDKIKKPGKAYTSLNEITDIVGIRITTYFESDVDIIKDIIEREFHIDINNSIDKRKAHDPDRFGYMSMHYIVSYKSDRSQLLEYAPFQDMKAEIQIRSILQHTWAEIEHDLGYKTKYAIPYYLKRRFSQLASLLELADREFLELKNKIEEYDKSVYDLLGKDLNSVFIDKNSVIIISENNDKIRTLDLAICQVTNARLTSNHDFSENIASMLLWININRASELMTHIDLHKKLIQDFARNWISQKNYSEFNHGISIMYLCYLILAQQQSEEKINDFAAMFNLGKHIDNFGVHLLHIYEETTSMEEATGRGK
ncbi:hypothetical protein CGT95_17705 [Vibrio metoecus]|nr:hypothetical protein CGT95_17705 [Vibrio metoecus]